MTDRRVIDLSEFPARVNVRGELLVIGRKDQPEVTVPMREIAVLVASHPAITISHAAIAALAGSKAAFLACDAKRHPAAMLLPLDNHVTQAERFRAQAAAPKPLVKRLWQTIVRAKLNAQADLLEVLGLDPALLRNLVNEVRSGDPANIEAQGARRYWSSLVRAEMLPPTFRRERYGPWPNALFNYGYAVLRAAAARAVSSAGLHPSIGLHHHNRYNAFCLADDLMEPYRPLVDRAVLRIADQEEPEEGISMEMRRELLNVSLDNYVAEGESRGLFDILERGGARLASALLGDIKPREFRLPEVLYASA